jgi:pyruvate formate lyase activating enzyme
MRIAGFVKTSLLDWDGKVSAVIYLPGCNFRCPFCHNRDLVLNPEQFEGIPFEIIAEYVSENTEFLDGIVITGGEPTLHHDLPELIKDVRALGMKVKLDTNGSNPDMVADLIRARLVDYIAMDLKAPVTQDKYSELIGVEAPLGQIKRSIELLMSSGVDYEFRTTVVPHMLGREDIERMAAYVGGARLLALQHFQPRNTINPALEVIKPVDEEKLREWAGLAKLCVRRVVIRGGV